jgi:quercetin dioxygenase-like cupin family protein
MALFHAKPWQAIDISPLGEQLSRSANHAILKTHSLELIRVVLPAGDSLPPHSVYGEVTLQCLEGEVEVEGEGGACRLAADQLVLLPAQARYAVRALQPASLLLTVQLPPGLPGSGSSTG